MAFEYKQFSDGEVSFRLPKWKQIIDDIHDELDTFRFEDETHKRQTIQEDEVGLKHPKNKSFIRIKDDGTIEAFTGYGTGLRIQPNETLQLFADRLQLIGREAQLETSPNASHINGKALAGDYPIIKQKGLTEKSKELIKGGETHAD